MNSPTQICVRFDFDKFYPAVKWVSGKDPWCWDLEVISNADEFQ